MNRLAAIVLVAWILLRFTAPAEAQLAHNKQTLRGHRKVYVSVTTPASDDITRQLGLVQNSLERYILAELNRAHIPASTELTDQTLILEIHVDVHKVLRADDLDVYAFVSRFDALQAARLATNGEAALAATWRTTQFGAVTVNQAQLLRDSVIRNLEQFIRDWKSAQAPEPSTP